MDLSNTEFENWAQPPRFPTFAPLRLQDDRRLGVDLPSRGVGIRGRRHTRAISLPSSQGSFSSRSPSPTSCGASGAPTGTERKPRKATPPKTQPKTKHSAIGHPAISKAGRIARRPATRRPKCFYRSLPSPSAWLRSVSSRISREPHLSHDERSIRPNPNHARISSEESPRPDR